MPSNPSRLTQFLALITTLSMPAMVSAVEKQAAEESVIEKAEEPAQESPWLLPPTVSADPKLGTTLGAVAGYIKAFDEKSPPP